MVTWSMHNVKIWKRKLWPTEQKPLLLIFWLNWNLVNFKSIPIWKEILNQVTMKSTNESAAIINSEAKK